MKKELNPVNSTSSGSVPSSQDYPGGGFVTAPRFSLILFILITISFYRELFGLASFYFRDFGIFGYPLAWYHRQSFWIGEIPLWNPYNECGLPFAAQWNTLVFYPLSLIYLLFPLPWSLGLFCLCHQFLGGVGMYCLTDRWTGSRLAAAAAGILFAFNGLTLNSLMWPNNIAAIGWMPWVLWSLDRAFTGNHRARIIAILLGTLQMLTGAPEFILFTWFLCAGLMFWRLSTGNHRLNIVLRFGIVLLGIAALSAIQLVPFLDLLLESDRTANFSDTSWSIDQTGWINFFVPLYRSFLVSGGVYLHDHQYWTSSFYCGVFVLVMGGWSAIVHRDRRLWALLGLFVLGVVLAGGENFFLYPIIKQLPLVSMMRYPVKFISLPVFIAPLILAFALANTFQHPPKPTRFALTIGGSLLVFGILLGWIRHQAFGPDMAGWSMVFKNGLARGVFLLATASVTWFCFQSSTIVVRRASELGLVLLLWVDLITHTPGQNPSIGPALLRPNLVRTEHALLPGADLGAGRLFLAKSGYSQLVTASVKYPSPEENFRFVRRGLFANLNLLEQWQKTDGMFSLHLRFYDKLYWKFYESRTLPKGLTEFIGITHIRDAEGWKTRRSFLPMGLIGAAPRQASDSDALDLVLAKNFDPRSEVLLSDGPPTRAARTPEAKILQQQISAQRLVFDVEVPGSESSILTIAQAWSRHWKAYLDERTVPVLRANYAFQGVEVPAGKHRVVLEYVDGSFRTGALISAAALIALLAGWWRFEKVEPASVVRPMEKDRNSRRAGRKR